MQKLLVAAIIGTALAVVIDLDPSTLKTPVVGYLDGTNEFVYRLNYSSVDEEDNFISSCSFNTTVAIKIAMYADESRTVLIDAEEHPSCGDIAEFGGDKEDKGKDNEDDDEEVTDKDNQDDKDANKKGMDCDDMTGRALVYEIDAHVVYYLTISSETVGENGTFSLTFGGYDDEDGDEKHGYFLIAGGVLVVATVAICCYCRRKRRQRRELEGQRALLMSANAGRLTTDDDMDHPDRVYYPGGEAPPRAEH